MGGRLGGWGVEGSEDEEGQESFMAGVSDMVCLFKPTGNESKRLAHSSSGHPETWSCLCFLAKVKSTLFLLPKALLPASLPL